MTPLLLCLLRVPSRAGACSAAVHTDSHFEWKYVIRSCQILCELRKLFCYHAFLGQYSNDQARSRTNARYATDLRISPGSRDGSRLVKRFLLTLRFIGALSAASGWYACPRAGGFKRLAGSALQDLYGTMLA